MNSNLNNFYVLNLIQATSFIFQVFLLLQLQAARAALLRVTGGPGGGAGCWGGPGGMGHGAVGFALW